MTTKTRWTIVGFATWLVGGPVGLVVGAMAGVMYAEPGAEPSIGLFWTVTLLTMAGIGWAAHHWLRPAR